MIKPAISLSSKHIYDEWPLSNEDLIWSMVLGLGVVKFSMSDISLISFILEILILMMLLSKMLYFLPKF